MSNYTELLQKGLAYQKFVGERLGLKFYDTEQEQYDIGEGPLGLEVKFDDQYKKTGNLYIEVAEKRDPKNEAYVASGILREDNTILWLIGDYQRAWLFAKRDLEDTCLPGHDLKQVQTPTSKGILVPEAVAKRIALRRWDWG